MTNKRVLQSLAGLEASRRVGWAKYYELVEEIELLKSLIHELADSVVFSPRLNNNDPIFEVVSRARAAARGDQL